MPSLVGSEMCIRDRYTAVQRDLSSGPTIRLRAVILAARLRLGGVILALTLLHTADQCGFSSGPTIHVGPVFFAARLRLRRVIILLTLVRTVVQRIFSIGPTQLGSVIAAARLRLGRVMFQSPQTYSSLCTITFITPKEARRAVSYTHLTLPTICSV